MSKFRKVDVRIWNDAKVRGLSPTAKLCFFFVLTNPGLTSVGAMRATLPGMAAELGITVETFAEGFAELYRLGLVDHDEEASFVALPNFLKYNRPENPNVVKGWATAVDLIPECDARTRYFSRVKEFVKGLGKSFTEALPEPFAKGLANQEPEQEPEPEPEQEQEPDVRSFVEDSLGGAGGKAGDDGSGIEYEFMSRFLESHLTDTGALCVAHRKAHSEHPELIPPTESGLLLVIEFAIHALRDGNRSKVALFHWMLRQPKEVKRLADDARAAKQRLKSHRQAIADDPAIPAEGRPLCDEPAHASRSAGHAHRNGHAVAS